MFIFPTQIIQHWELFIFILGLISIWDLSWKGVALRYAAQRGEKIWFIFLLILNSVGILPIIYLIRLKILRKQALSSNNS